MFWFLNWKNMKPSKSKLYSFKGILLPKACLRLRNAMNNDNNLSIMKKNKKINIYGASLTFLRTDYRSYLCTSIVPMVSYAKSHLLSISIALLISSKPLSRSCFHWSWSKLQMQNSSQMWPWPSINSALSEFII